MTAIAIIQDRDWHDFFKTMVRIVMGLTRYFECGHSFNETSVQLFTDDFAIHVW